MRMSNPPSPESELLQELLDPLLEDFRYWFGRSRDLLELQKLSFLSDAEQSSLLSRVKDALKEVETATVLFNATGKQVGIDIAAMKPWHGLLMECQSVGIRYHQSKTT
ncbi:DUF2605 domain-containing protein [Pseudanabaena sp. PCC 6802]|uniref:DUF2605 domain-containing protein n=1 Tax=Pseudanabaena sp. PCC 6802 TaxID=118173 RepID=UPI000345BAED